MTDENQADDDLFLDEDQDEGQPEPEPVEVEAEPEAEEPEKEPEPQQSEAEKGLLAELSRLRAEMREMKAQPQEEKPLPDVFEDPNGYSQAISSQVQKMVQNERLNMSEAIAREKFGDEKVDAARQALMDARDQAAYAQIMQSPMPYAALVKWHEQQTFFKQVGSDPQAFMARERDRIKAEVMAEIEAQTTAKAVKSAPSLASQTSIGGRTSSAAPTLTPLDDLLP